MYRIIHRLRLEAAKFVLVILFISAGTLTPLVAQAFFPNFNMASATSGWRSFVCGLPSFLLFSIPEYCIDEEDVMIPEIPDGINLRDDDAANIITPQASVPPSTIRVVNVQPQISYPETSADYLLSLIAGLRSELEAFRSKSVLQTDRVFKSIGNSVDDLDAASISGLGTLATVSSIDNSDWSGTELAIGNGGTGTSTAPAYGQVLLGNALGAYDLVATSSLGISGGGSSYTDSDTNSYIHASTTIPKTYTANTFTGLQTFTGGLTTSALTLGSLNGPLQSISGVVSATTSISVVYGGTGLSTAPAYGQLLLGNSSGGYTLTATSSLGLSSFELATTTEVSSTFQVSAWGDSLTAGSGSTIAYSGYMSTYLSRNGVNIYNGGVGGETSTQIAARMLAAPESWDDWTIIWSGRNNFASQSTILTDIASMVSVLKSPKHFLVLSILNASSETSGSGSHTSILADNAALASAYPDNYFDIRGYLLTTCNAIGPSNATGWYASTTQDQIDCGDDVIPTSLRSDFIHLNNSGYQIVGQKVAALVEASQVSYVAKAINYLDIPTVQTSMGITASTSRSNWFFGNMNPTLAAATGTLNTGTGAYTLNSLTSGSYNSAYGWLSSAGNKTGSYNTALGVGAMRSSTSTNYSTAVGMYSLYNFSQTGDRYNVALGANSMFTLGSGSSNTCVGVSCFYYGTANSNNVGLGTGAGFLNTTGSQNTFLGTLSGDEVTTGSNNIVIGYDVDAPSDTGSNQLNIGNTLFGVNINSTDKSIDTDALFGIGTTSPFARLSVQGLGGSAPLFTISSSTAGLGTTTPFFVASNGNVGVGTTSPLYPMSISSNTVGQALRVTGAQTSGMTPTRNLATFESSVQSAVLKVGYVNSAGTLSETVGIGNGSLAGYSGESFGGLDIAYSGPTLTMGADNNSTTRTNSTSKVARIAMAPYTTTQLPVNVLHSTSNSSSNTLGWGGGTSILQSMTQHDFYTAQAINTVTGISRMTIRSTGLIGFNDTTPSHILDIALPSDSTAKTSAFSGIAVSNTATSSTASIIKAGMDISSTGTWSGTTASNIGLYVSAVTGGTSNYDAIFNGGGNVGIATTSPWRSLSVAGTAAFSGLTGSTGAGSICLTTGGELVYNSGSDACLPSLRDTKHAIENLNLNALSVIEDLDPASFIYNDGDQRVRYGFIAEDTMEVDEHLVTYDADGEVSGIDDRAVLSLLVKVVKELTSAAREWVVAKITATLAIFDRVETKQLKTDELCLDDVCITKTQLQALLNHVDIETTTAQPPIVLDDEISTTTEEIATTTAEIVEDNGGDDDSNNSTSTTTSVVEDVVVETTGPEEEEVASTTPEIIEEETAVPEEETPTEEPEEPETETVVTEPIP